MPVWLSPLRNLAPKSLDEFTLEGLIIPPVILSLTHTQDRNLMAAVPLWARVSEHTL